MGRLQETGVDGRPRKWFCLAALVCAAFGLIAVDTAIAQNQPASAPQSSDQLLKPEQLDALVAPIALYPDNLLSLVLMASSYPLEVVQADRWVKENKNLKGDEQKAAADKEGWDDSIKSLVATPDVLSMMSSKLDWTMKLGDAVLAQQPDVMDAIQRLRAKAEANNKLTTTKQQTVSRRQEQGRQIIAIEPTDPETIYVPYYDPAVVYGGWPYPEYPPYYFGYPGYIAGGLIATGLVFGAGYALGRWASGGNYWGGGFNWNNNNININRPRVNPLNGNNWQHRPEHRHGVRYNNGNVQNRFGNNRMRAGASNRMDFRGRGGNQVLRPGGGQGANRPGAGQRPAQRPSAGQRPSGGRPSAGPTPIGRAARRATAIRRTTCRSTAFGTWTRRRIGLCRRWRWQSRRPARRSGARELRQPRWWWFPRRRRRSRWRWTRRWWTALGYRAQARHRPARASRQRSWILSLQLQRERSCLCRSTRAGSTSGCAEGRSARPRWLLACLL